jgi:hypothetical protein
MSYEPANNILRDKAHGWSLNYYNDKTSSYDVPLARAQAMLELMKKEGELQAAHKAHASFLATMTKQTQGRLKEDIKAVESVIGQLKGDVSRLSFISYNVFRPATLSASQDNVDTLAYKQLLEQQRFSSLQKLRNLFMESGDEEAMRQGVAAVEERFKSTMASLDTTTVLAADAAPAVFTPTAAFAAVAEVVHKKRTKRYSEAEDDGWDELEKVGGWRSNDW